MVNRNEKRTETIIYTQFQSWSTVDVLSCMEQTDSPVRVREFHKIPRSHAWRSTLGYEVLDATPLFAQSVTNLMDACRIPYGMITKPLKFPNLVTGFDRSPLHAARAALYMRYTPYDWKQNQIRLYNEADANRCYSEKLCKDSVRLIREIDEKVQKKQLEMENDQKHNKKITFWRNEVALELEKLITEGDKIQECHRALQIAIQNLEEQLHIAQECLYHRESRENADLVHDEVESALLKEIEMIKNCEKKLKQFMDRCINQLTSDRAVQHQLQLNLQDKETGLGIDTCHQINDFSRDLQYHDKIKKYPSITDIESWAEMINNVVKKSEAERVKSHQLRNDIDSVVNVVNYEIYEAWKNTNKSLDRKAIEILEIKKKLQTYIHKIEEEILNIEKNIKLIQKTITIKDLELKVANTRLETNIYHPEAKLSKDHIQFRMIKKVKDMIKIIYNMNLKLQQCEAQHQQLLHTRCNLKSDLKSKIDALFIDREKCMGLRRSYPISTTIKF